MKYLADVKSQIEDKKIMVTDFFSIKDGVIKTLTPYIDKKLMFDAKTGLSYCAGQDYIAELNTIRKILREGK